MGPVPLFCLWHCGLGACSHLPSEHTRAEHLGCFGPGSLPLLSLDVPAAQLCSVVALPCGGSALALGGFEKLKAREPHQALPAFPPSIQAISAFLPSTHKTAGSSAPGCTCFFSDSRTPASPQGAVAPRVINSPHIMQLLAFNSVKLPCLQELLLTHILLVIKCQPYLFTNKTKLIKYCISVS